MSPENHSGILLQFIPRFFLEWVESNNDTNSQNLTLCMMIREIKQNHKKFRRKRNADWRSQR